MNQPLPEINNVRTENGDAQLVVEMHIPPDLVHFSGHFPGLPVVPGVVQIDWAVHFAQKHLPITGRFSGMENIKFQALLLPDADVELILKWDADKGRVEFTFTDENRIYSSGRLLFGKSA